MKTITTLAAIFTLFCTPLFACPDLEQCQAELAEWEQLHADITAEIDAQSALVGFLIDVMRYWQDELDAAIIAFFDAEQAWLDAGGQEDYSPEFNAYIDAFYAYESANQNYNDAVAAVDANNAIYEQLQDQRHEIAAQLAAKEAECAALESGGGDPENP